MQYSTLEEIQAPGPEPIGSDFVSDDGNFTFRVEGLQTYKQRQDIITEINKYQSAIAKTNDDGESTFKVPTPQESFTPSAPHVVAACYLAACVTAPKLESLQWLQFARNRADVLMEAYGQCLINSRIIDDPDAKDKPGTLDEAKATVQADPLDSGG